MPSLQETIIEDERTAAHIGETSTVETPLLSSSSIETNSNGTVYYLAYGSNLSKATFRGMRGINPLSSQNVHVPSLDLTFDLPGMPYSEPCFANSRYRDINAPPTKSPYHKDRWQNGMIGVVYEVTIDDFRTIIKTEGGGVGYQDVIVDCFVLPEGVKSLDKGLRQDGTAIRAHTLLASRDNTSGWATRADPSYAQPSARYLGLIISGGEEHNLPADYMEYLKDIRPYRVTTFRQKVGKRVFGATWWTGLMFIFTMGRLLSGKDGRVPGWYAVIMKAYIQLLFFVYDNVLKKVFGDGERTIEDAVAAKQFRRVRVSEK